ncbi:MAG: hypothetical protein LBJ24_05815 [Treponema sp.]|jgi:hypothetical protein|nr:hypothetical protein [Treponema sp.]
MFRFFVKTAKARTVKPRRIPRGGILCLLLFLFLSCNQDAIFFHVSQEVEPKDPRIEGTPSKMVRFGSAAPVPLYVANGHLHRYTEGGTSLPNPARGIWDYPTEQPPGGAVDLAATAGFLYARTGNGDPSSFGLYRSTDGDTWPGGAPASPTDGGRILLPGGYAPQTIYSANNILFIGAAIGSGNYAIFYLDTSDNLVQINTFTSGNASGGILRGARHNSGTYYLATSTRGIFSLSALPSVGNNPTPNDTTNLIPNSNTKGEFWSLIEVTPSKFFAIGPGIWDVTVTDFSNTAPSPFLMSGSFKGSAFWPKPASSPSDLLLLGTHGSGYREVSIDASGNLVSISTPRWSIPHGSTSEYNAMLDDETINYLCVLSEISANADPVIFASTQREGLWSYRNGEWNYED